MLNLQTKKTKTIVPNKIPTPKLSKPSSLQNETRKLSLLPGRNTFKTVKTDKRYSEVYLNDFKSFEDKLKDDTEKFPVKEDSQVLSRPKRHTVVGQGSSTDLDKTSQIKVVARFRPLNKVEKVFTVITFSKWKRKEQDRSVLRSLVMSR